jgi:low affinity Fe/Cu permease
MDNHPLRRGLTKLGVLAAHPAAFLIVLIYAVAWILLQPESFDWHGVATIATWLMTLFIQRAEHRDTQAIQAKLDELLRAHSGARNDLADIDEQEPEDIEIARGKPSLT